MKRSYMHVTLFLLSLLIALARLDADEHDDEVAESVHRTQTTLRHVTDDKLPTTLRHYMYYNYYNYHNYYD